MLSGSWASFVCVQLQYNDFTQWVYGTIQWDEEVWTGQICCSVVPRSPHHLVFNCFQYIKLEVIKMNGGKAWECVVKVEFSLHAGFLSPHVGFYLTRWLLQFNTSCVNASMCIPSWPSVRLTCKCSYYLKLTVSVDDMVVPLFTVWRCKQKGKVTGCQFFSVQIY